MLTFGSLASPYTIIDGPQVNFDLIYPKLQDLVYVVACTAVSYT